MKTNIELLEEQFSNLCHVVSNENLGIQFRHKDNPKTVESTKEIAIAMMNFKNSFVKFRENGYK